MTDFQIIVTTVIGLLTILGGIYTALQARKANKESTVVTGYDSLTEHLQAQVSTLGSEVEEQHARIAVLERKVDLFVRWGRAVIRWYESITFSEKISPMPKPHTLLDLNGTEGS
jgi:hypothetical protein